MQPWICVDSSLGCVPTALCDGCRGRELAVALPQARVLGEQWAEQVARRPEHRGHDQWPQDERALTIARRKVRSLATDERLVEPLAEVCIRGAAEWWGRRSARYR
jgi:hypothetical protein